MLKHIGRWKKHSRFKRPCVSLFMGSELHLHVFVSEISPLHAVRFHWFSKCACGCETFRCSVINLPVRESVIVLNNVELPNGGKRE